MASLKPQDVADERAKSAFFAHFAVRTAQYEKMVSWYSDVLSCETVFANDELTFLTFDEEHHRLVIIHEPNAKEGGKTYACVDHVGYTLNDIDVLVSTYKRLEDKGIFPTYTVNHGTTTSLYYEDPDGLKVEFQVDNFTEAGDVSKYFRSEDFANDPYGIVIDPKLMARLYRPGMSHHQLLNDIKANMELAKS